MHSWGQLEWSADCGWRSLYFPPASRTCTPPDTHTEPQLRSQRQLQRGSQRTQQTSSSAPFLSRTASSRKELHHVGQVFTLFAKNVTFREEQRALCYYAHAHITRQMTHYDVFNPYQIRSPNHVRNVSDALALDASPDLYTWTSREFPLSAQEIAALSIFSPLPHPYRSVGSSS